VRVPTHPRTPSVRIDKGNPPSIPEQKFRSLQESAEVSRSLPKLPEATRSRPKLPEATRSRPKLPEVSRSLRKLDEVYGSYPKSPEVARGPLTKRVSSEVLKFRCSEAPEVPNPLKFRSAPKFRSSEVGARSCPKFRDATSSRAIFFGNAKLRSVA
jgi:hypothetical protein